MSASFAAVEAAYLEPTGAAALDWQYQAACAGVDTDQFFTAGGRPPAATRELCESCPVRPECLAYALERDWVRGMWGGTTTAERDQMRAAGQDEPPERYCRRGHLLDEANTYWRTDGYPACRQCIRDRQAAKRDAKKRGGAA